jgi:hypothetical protein
MTAVLAWLIVTAAAVLVWHVLAGSAPEDDRHEWDFEKWGKQW